MGLFINSSINGIPTIDWEMTPEYTFGTYESWGGVERVRSSNERVYYFFIDAWGNTAKLCLMERGIKHARVVAEIKAPQDLIDQCVQEQGIVARFERTFAVNEELKKWLKENVIEGNDQSLVTVLADQQEELLRPSGLPARDEQLPLVPSIALPYTGGVLSEEEIIAQIKLYDLVDLQRNPQGGYRPDLVDSGDGLTVIDRVSGLMWQREGLDISSNRTMRKAIEQLNAEGYAGLISRPS